MRSSNPLSRPSQDTAPALAELQAIYDQRSPVPARFRDMSWSSWFAPFHGSPGPPCQELGAELRIISCVSGADARSVSGAVSLGAPPGGSTGLGSVFGPPVGDRRLPRTTRPSWLPGSPHGQTTSRRDEAKGREAIASRLPAFHNHKHSRKSVHCSQCASCTIFFVPRVRCAPHLGIDV